MYKSVKFITSIKGAGFSTYYLFCSSSRILLPINIENSRENEKSVPTIYDSIKRLLFGAGIKVLGIKIYYECDNIFYAYLTILKDKKKLDINISFKDAINIAKEVSAPIYVKKPVMDKSGIKITKSMIQEALQTTIN
jgi:bifunctional DNase/RNase